MKLFFGVYHCPHADSDRPEPCECSVHFVAEDYATAKGHRPHQPDCLAVERKVVQLYELDVVDGYTVTLAEKIVLNGKIGDVATDDVTDRAIGIITGTRKVPGFYPGEKNNEGFAFSKKMAEKLGFGKRYATLRYYTSPSPIDPDKVEEQFLKSLYGLAEAEYEMRYSETTGYLWTDEDFKVGRHDILKLLESHRGEYIHLELILHDTPLSDK